VITADVDVYRAPPRFITGVGWQGERIDVLRGGTQVLQCRESSVTFGFSSKTWAQVAYRQASGWRYGWVLQENMRFVWNDGNQPSTLIADWSAILPVGLALAAEGAAASQEKWEIPDVAPAPSAAPGAEAKSTPVQEIPVNAPGLLELLTLYWPLFCAMILGMVVKACVDLIDDWNKALAFVHLRQGIVALLVSPIVFLGFLNAGNFEGSKQTFLVLLLLAFQNGFFWQTVLRRAPPAPETKSPA